MDCSFSIIIPTCGRRSLQRTLRSIGEQTLMDGDEVLLVTDGPQPLAGELFAASGLPGQCIETAVTRDIGASQRNRGMDLAAGRYLLFMDDDDVFAPDAFAAIRAAVRATPGRPHLFRMRYAATGRVLWASHAIALGNVSTDMIVFPNLPQLQRWDKRDGHDFRFVVNNLPLWPTGSLVWREEVIAIVRPTDGEFLPLPRSSAMTSGPRRVEDCPYRDCVPTEKLHEVACCRLVRQIIGAEGSEWCEVRRDACEACCTSFPPSPIDINPVIASVLYNLTDRIIERGGVSGCETDRAAGLQDWAAVSLELDTPPESSAIVPARATGPCCYLGQAVGFRVQPGAEGLNRLPVHECRHPGHRETTLHECYRCRDWADRPGLVPVPLEQLVPPPAEKQGPRIRRWAVGVTTAPRRQSTLEWCLDSLVRSGWEEPRLFVDSAVTIAKRYAGLPVSLRESKLGAWPNYYLSLVELLMREPEADAFLLVQDDVVLYDRYNLRVYLERYLWPSVPVGAVSLFCSSAYTQPQSGWHRLGEPWVWGALAFLFPRESAKRFIADPVVLEHRWCHHNRGLANIDTVIGEWANRHGLPIYFPTPSLAQHVGDSSTLWPNARSDGSRRADRFVGDLECGPRASI
jgi:hypothetical protein